MDELNSVDIGSSARARSEAAQWLREHCDRVAARSIDDALAQDPTMADRYPGSGRTQWEHEVRRHIEQLTSAIASGVPALFVDYLGWIRVLFATRAISTVDAARSLKVLSTVLDRELPRAFRAMVLPVIEPAEHAFSSLPEGLPSEIVPTDRHAVIARSYLDALLSGHGDTAIGVTLEAAQRGVAVGEIYMDVLQPALRELGRLWQINEVSVAQEHYCSAVTQRLMAQLSPRVFGSPRIGLTLVASCVMEELHEIGLRMVADLFELAGWDSYYLGANMPLPDLVAIVAQRRTDLVAISATRNDDVAMVAEYVRAIHAHPETAGTPIIVGGRPFNVVPDLWRCVHADGTASSGDAAVALGRRLVAKEQFDVQSTP